MSSTMEFEQLVAPKSSAPVEADNKDQIKGKEADPKVGRLINRRPEDGHVVATLVFRTVRAGGGNVWPLGGHAVDNANVRFAFHKVIDDYTCEVVFNAAYEDVAPGYYVFGKEPSVKIPPKK